MAARLRLGTVVLLALTPSACTLLDGLGGLTGAGGDDASGDVVGADAPDETADAPGSGGDVGTTDTGKPGPESGADAARDVGRETEADSTTMDVVQDVTSPPDVQEAPPLAYFQVVAMDMPQAYWRLDEPVGSTTAHDATGNGHDGTYTGGVTLAQPGAIANDADTAVTFDGASGYVDVKNSFAFAGMSAFTLEAWVKPTTLDANFHSWMGRNDGQPPTEGYLAYTDPSGPFFVVERIDSTTKVFANGSIAPAAATWAYVVITYQSGTGPNVWVNGQIGTGSSTDVSLAGATSDFVIGAENGGLTSWWLGEIDEVAVYAYALSQMQIQNHYNVGTGH